MKASYDTTGLLSYVTAFWKEKVLSAVVVPQALTAFGEEQVLKLLRLFIWRQIVQLNAQMQPLEKKQYCSLEVQVGAIHFMSAFVGAIMYDVAVKHCKNLVADDLFCSHEQVNESYSFSQTSLPAEHKLCCGYRLYTGFGYNQYS